MDVWVSDPRKEPMGMIIFNFTSKGSFTANYPINVKVTIFLTKGVDYNFSYSDLSPITVVFPDSFAYPRRGTEAGQINMSHKDGIVGEADIEFTTGGDFGYIVFSKGEPFFYAAEQKIITVASPEARLQIEADSRGFGLSIIGVGTTVIGLMYELYERSEKSRSSDRAKELRRRVRRHHCQLIDEIYEKWFDRPTPSIDVGDIVTEYNIESTAKVIYRNRGITVVEPTEPWHENKRIVDEATEHLKCYAEAWSLWTNTKADIKQNLDNVEKLWDDLEKKLVKRLSVDCPHLIEWHGYGQMPENYYSLRLTFSSLWFHVETNRFPLDPKIRAEGSHFIVSDLARSVTKDTIERFVRVIGDLATDPLVQQRMNEISSQKATVEANLTNFRNALSVIADDVKRRNRGLKCRCPTCESWLDELGTLEGLRTSA